MLLVASALFLGFLHGLGADHLMAIAALSVGGVTETAAVQRTRALSVAFRFACGHALLLAVAAGGLLLLGWSLPVMFERMGELLGGGLLIVLGGIGLWAVRAGRVYGHSHRDSDAATHWHLHLGRPDRHPLDTAHSHLPTLVGAAFALSSVRALTMLAPFGGRVGDTPLVTLLDPDRRLWYGNPAVDVALRRRLRARHVRRRCRPPRSGRRPLHGADLDRARRLLDRDGLISSAGTFRAYRSSPG